MGDETKAKSIETKLASQAPNLNSDDDQDQDMGSDEFDDDSDESSDDEHEWTQKVKEVHKALNQEAYERRKAEKTAAKIARTIQYDMHEKDPIAPKQRGSKKSLADRIESQSEERIERKDGHQMVFREKKSRKQLQQEEDQKAHRQERLEVRRSASGLKKDRIKPKFFRGKRVI